ncbi:Acylphosphatase family protein [Pelomyxa schiedti]|nr:Acylphosphatase family protein [Pelomyxa schiedti]
MSTTTRYFTVCGKVQAVMFRQTLLRGAGKRGLKAGASNSAQNKNEVTFTLSGQNSAIQEIVDFMKSGKALNDWGAQVAELVETSTGKPIESHQVTSSNVDQFHWNPDVTMYL